MNKQHKCLKFTSEAENDNSFSFLDIKITRHNQQFKTSVYRKPTFSGLFTHYESYMDQTYKKSLIDTSLFHCFSICYEYISFHLEVENLREVLKLVPAIFCQIFLFHHMIYSALKKIRCDTETLSIDREIK